MTAVLRSRLLLSAGAALGIAFAIFGMLKPVESPRALAADEAARVNSVSISRQDLSRALARIGADKKNPLADTERRHVLERLIDDELLVQRGAALGLVESDAVVRKALASAVIASVVAEAASVVPTDAELEAFFAANAAYFARPGRARIARIGVRDGPDADSRVAAALAALDAGATSAEVQSRYGDDGSPALPDVPLPEVKLRELLGPTHAGVALALEPGAHSPVLVGDGTRSILVSLGRESASVPDLREVRPQVEAEWTRRAGERALSAYLADLRRDAAISRADGAKP